MPKASNFTNMVLCLFCICLGGSAVMGSVYVLTKDTIEAAQIAKENQAIAQVLPPFDNDPFAQRFESTVDGKTFVCYPATSAGKPVGLAIKAATTKGFGGTVQAMVGFLPDGTICRTALLSHSETPGLGDRLDPQKSPFTLQFEGKHLNTFRAAVVKDGGDVDAITAATISSRAFCDLVNAAYKTFEAQGGDNE